MKGALVHHPEGAECAAAASLRLFEYLQDTGGLLPGRKESRSITAVLAAFFVFIKLYLAKCFPLRCCLFLNYATICVIIATEGWIRASFSVLLDRSHVLLFFIPKNVNKATTQWPRKRLLNLLKKKIIKKINKQNNNKQSTKYILRL